MNVITFVMAVQISLDNKWKKNEEFAERIFDVKI